MGKSYILKVLKLIVAVLLCFPALLMPYELRMKYNKGLAFFFHLPFVVFGKLTHYLLKMLGVRPDDIDWN
ncbi:MAG: hypothetical protein PHW04_14795 [Candidatus Wallbacteria bacterium]|nr:hypothetical protein [Candidatus Wallbacteria bacterium]